MGRVVRIALLAAAIMGLAAVVLVRTGDGRRLLLWLFEGRYQAQGSPDDLRPRFEGPDATRPRLAISLTPVVVGLHEPTDFQAVPGQDTRAVVLEKGGEAWMVSLADGTRSRWLSVQVLTASEQGLLGLAFHPDFARNGRFFLDYVAEVDGADRTVIAEWHVDPARPVYAHPTPVRTVLHLAQPYANHNGGQIAFGPDGKLYVGLGDGGAANDPHGNGQNLSTLLGSMLRLDVDASETAPPDNPFVGRPGARPEIWAHGLRNPWRFSFAPDGRLVVGDVGQNHFEEVTILGRGDNAGWARREADHCFPSGRACSSEGLVEPIYSYPHAEGQSVTGGVVYTGGAVPGLFGRYVFGDFVSGRLWALDLPPPGGARAPAIHALGRFSILPSAFGRDARGEVYVVDYGAGRVLRIGPGG